MLSLSKKPFAGDYCYATFLNFKNAVNNIYNVVMHVTLS